MNNIQPGTHLDSLIRQTQTHHIQLSSMADLKANILITMSSVVITMSYRYISHEELRWAVMFMIAMCLVTIILSVYAVMPKISSGRKKGATIDIGNPDFNLLFFGDFVRMPYDEYIGAMGEIMSDTGKCYEAQLREIYILGKFLARTKYRYVRIAYAAFISGLAGAAIIASVNVFTG